ncbi:response regulator [Shewanella sp. AS1]|uniref:HD-GYP domain-containing protein n=1 Tax=Shewanella sp. AS1 TaxID=2907626 RepID=UPI001F29320E|nr:HD domain-containing phosphohydrolase [Shewanella sp. AS1]MCE9680598.1 response regulator [Shewanella sp. AS1]
MSSKDNKQIILVVDDTPDNIDIIAQILRPEFKVRAANNGIRALEIAVAHPQPDLILLDIMMPDIDGYQVIKQLKANPKTAAIPVIFISAKTEIEDEKLGFELGAVDYITKPISAPKVVSRVTTHLALYDQNRALETKVAQRTQELAESRELVIHCLGRAAEFKDNETGLHVIRMSHYTAIIARAANQREDWCQLLKSAAPMHDIGKIGIPDSIMLKTGPLNEAEWEIMRQHPQIGATIIGDTYSALLDLARSISMTHHERWDGTGYPKRLKGTNIPLEGRIVALADVFDALTNERPYKKAWPVEEAVEYIKAGSGSHFDPELVYIFLEVLPQLLDVYIQYSEVGQGAVCQSDKERIPELIC